MNRSLRVLLFAHHHTGVAALTFLRDAGHEITGCFTHPTARDWIPSMSDACGAAGVRCSEAVPDASAALEQRERRPDLVLSIGYRRRIALPFLALPRWGAINASLAPLPRYRGGSPVPWGILNQEPSWGVTVHAMTHNYNEGGILRRQPVVLRDTDNAYDLFLRSSRAAAQVAVEAVNDIAAGGGELVAQDLREVTFFDAAPPFGGRIDWNQPATSLSAFVRAMDFGREGINAHYEHLARPAMASMAGEEIGIWRASAGGTASPYPPGTITHTDGAVWVQTGRGHLVLERLCDANGRDFGRRLSAARGLAVGQSFDAAHLANGESRKLSHAA